MGKDGRLLKRLLHQAAYEIHFTAKKTGLNEEVEEAAFLILQHALKG